ncbi:anti-sigma factor [Hydrogenophaga sp.]|uniref:anti-sigma factor domain-containing protein n=1 Tax=Hydrogenophaga sp. TaxID=1904254 RepID=UPI0025C586C1|nr:anti-sigma factor [Hydrogenophaga sp.]
MDTVHRMNEPSTSSDPTPASGFRSVSTWWRALAILLLLVLLIGWAASASMFEQLKAQISHLQSRLVEVPQVRQIAVLQDDDQLPAMLVTYDPKRGALLLQRLNEVREGREDSMQLWALVGGAPPRSLGVITSKYQTLELPVSEAALENVSQLAISAENKGGVAAGASPSLPYLFKGWWVKKTI